MVRNVIRMKAIVIKAQWLPCLCMCCMHHCSALLFIRNNTTHSSETKSSMACAIAGVLTNPF